jgi:protein-S-isoprenylcysteine O-methyltransferase Ste14
VLAGIATLALFATARIEGQQNLQKFGANYREHMKQTRRFIPFIF